MSADRRLNVGIDLDDNAATATIPEELDTEGLFIDGEPRLWEDVSG